MTGKPQFTTPDTVGHDRWYVLVTEFAINSYCQALADFECQVPLLATIKRQYSPEVPYMSRIEMAEEPQKNSSVSHLASDNLDLQVSNVNHLKDNSNAKSLLDKQFGIPEIAGLDQLESKAPMKLAGSQIGSLNRLDASVGSSDATGKLDFGDNSIFKSVFSSSGDNSILLAQNVRLFEGLSPAVQKHYDAIRNGVSDAFNEPFANRTKGLNGLEIVKDLTVGGYLGKNTNEPPMFDDAYSAKVTRPYEQRLMKDLQADQGPISHKTLVERAMYICNNDKYLTTLTLANFTKNIASVERGQAPVTDRPRPDMGYPFDTFSKQQSDNVFNRLERFDQNSPDKMSKTDVAGTLYHFYGGILASSAGLGGGVHLENGVFGWNRDPRKREAGSLGASVGDRVFGEGQQFNDAFKNLLR